MYYIHNFKVNNNYEIKQVHMPNNEILENALSEKLPTIITGTIYNWSEFYDYSPNFIQQNYETVLDKSNKHQSDGYIKIDNFYKKINKLDIINKYTKHLHFPYSIYKQYDLTIGNPKYKTELVRCNIYRQLLCQMYGTLNICLFAPNQTQFLYPYPNNTNKSMCNFWDIDDVKFPNFNSAKYIEIILKQGQILYVPKGWWYCIHSPKQSITIISKSKPFFII